MSSQSDSNIQNNVALSPPLEIKKKERSIISIRLNNPFHQNFFPYLMSKLNKENQDIKNSLVILDLESIQHEEAEIPFKALIHGFKAHSLHPIAIENANNFQYSLASAAGLPIWNEQQPSNTAKTNAESENNLIKNSPEQITTQKTFSETVIIHEPVRSGKQIYAENADLIVLAPISAGAEVVADGNIHIYNQLNGKALAGFKGNQNSRIFCHEMNAELISIAGIYQINEDIDSQFFKQNIQIFIKDDNLQLEIIR